MRRPLAPWILILLAGWCLPAYATERVAETPADNGRAVNDAKIINATKPTGCVGGVMNQAAKVCPIACQVNMPTSKLPTADSCDPRNWACVWPKQALNKTENCATGWNGTSKKDEIYEVQNCGSKLVDTHTSSPTTIGCTRTRQESKNEACPTGGGWTGAGVTRIRNVMEQLELDMTTATTTSTTEWTVSTVACNRVSDQHDYARCPLGSGTCQRVTDQSGSPVYGDTCGGSAPGNSNETKRALTQHLANDLVTPVTDAAGAVSTVQTSCANCTTPWGSVLASGQSTTAYAANTVPYGQSCSSASNAETRTCANGVLSGSMANGGCTVNPPPVCQSFGECGCSPEYCPGGNSCTFVPSNGSPAIGVGSGAVVNYSCPVQPPSRPGLVPGYFCMVMNIGNGPEGRCSVYGVGYWIVRN